MFKAKGQIKIFEDQAMEPSQLVNAQGTQVLMARKAEARSYVGRDP